MTSTSPFVATWTAGGPPWQALAGGVLTAGQGETTHEAGAGTLVWLPRAEPHTFANLSDRPVRTFGVITPAGLEAMFRETEESFGALTGAPDPPAGAVGARYVLRRHGTRTGPAVGPRPGSRSDPPLPFPFIALSPIGLEKYFCTADLDP